MKKLILLLVLIFFVACRGAELYDREEYLSFKWQAFHRKGCRVALYPYSGTLLGTSHRDV